MNIIPLVPPVELMNTEVQIDDKGRIVIPIEIREKFNIKSGEKIQILVENDTILLKPKLSTKEMIKKIQKLRTEISSKNTEPLRFEKLFGE